MSEAAAHDVSFPVTDFVCHSRCSSPLPYHISSRPR
jgi:hypothetical protein